MMEVSKTTAINLMKHLGFHTADTWDGNRLYRKINKLHNVVTSDTVLNDDKYNTLLQEIMEYDGVIAIKDDVSKDSKKDTPEPSIKPVTTKKKTTNRDILGSKEGSFASEVNTFLCDIPIGIPDIIKTLGNKKGDYANTYKAVYNHLSNMVKKGKVVKKGAKYRIG